MAGHGCEWRRARGFRPASQSGLLHCLSQACLGSNPEELIQVQVQVFHGEPEEALVYTRDECSLGYSGNLCDSCILDFYKTGRGHTCSRCPANTINMQWAWLVITIIWTLILTTVTIKSTLLAAEDPDDRLSLMLKILCVTSQPPS